MLLEEMFYTERFERKNHARKCMIQIILMRELLIKLVYYDNIYYIEKDYSS